MQKPTLAPKNFGFSDMDDVASEMESEDEMVKLAEK
jgi:hypothetical protein